MQASVDTAERIGSNAEVQSEVASALARGSSVEAISARTGLPPDFFEVIYHMEKAMLSEGPSTLQKTACPTWSLPFDVLMIPQL